MNKVLYATTLTTFALLSTTVCFGQRVKLIASSKTSWSGGIAGRHGDSYNFSVEFSGLGKIRPILDTLWLGDQPFPVALRDSTGRGFNCTAKEASKKTTYTLFVGTSEDDNAERSPTPVHAPDDDKTDKQGNAAPPSYSGVALLTYTLGSKKGHFVIDRIITHHPPVNYP